MPIRLNGSTSGRIEIDAPAVAGTTNITLPATAGEILVGGTDGGSVHLPAGTTAQRPTDAQAGDMRFNTTTGQVEYWSSTSLIPQWLPVTTTPLDSITVDFLVIAGGGGGGANTGSSFHFDAAGGGGAGGYRTSWGSGAINGGLTDTETAITAQPDTAYTVTVGAGGAATNSGAGNNGANSVFATITSTGGGGGGVASQAPCTGQNGGSRGGGSDGA